MCLSLMPATVFAAGPVYTNAAITFKVVNGTWADGTSDPKNVTVSMRHGEGTPEPEQFPTGMKPNEGYQYGAWYEYPNIAGNGIKRDESYFYSFVPISSDYQPDPPRKMIINGTSALRNPKERRDQISANYIHVDYIPSDYIWFYFCIIT